MKTVALGAWVVLVGILSVAFSELTLMGWLSVAPMAVTSHLFWLGILPAAWVAVGIATLLMYVALKHKPRVFIPLYVTIFVVAHAVELHGLSNPLPDIALYVAAILVASLFWYLVWWRRALRPPTH